MTNKRMIIEIRMLICLPSGALTKQSGGISCRSIAAVIAFGAPTCQHCVFCEKRRRFGAMASIS